jgi:branched-chain amino acid transport system permease protein
VEFISEVVWGRFLEIHFLILGLILVLVVIFTPKGLVGLAAKRFSVSEFLKGIRQNRV